MEFTATQIAHLIGGKVVGNGDFIINNFAKIEEGKEGCISFLANSKYEEFLYTTLSTVVLVADDFVPKKAISNTLIYVGDPYLAISTLMLEYKKIKEQKSTGIEEMSFVSKNSLISEGVYIGAFSYLSENVIIGKNVQVFPQVFIGKNVEIGENTIIYPGAKIYEGCKIGSNCMIHSGAVIGADGFGFAPNSEGIYQEIPQLGNVVIEDDVSIGANATIDRATMGSTIVKKGSKVDNLVQVAHNVEIGKNTVIAALTGISGSTKIGNNCMIGGQVGFVGHIVIADGTKIGAQSGVSKNIIKPNQTFAGRPLLPFNDHLKMLVNLRKLSKNSDKN